MQIASASNGYIATKVKPDVQARIYAMARAEDRTASAVMRRLISQGLAVEDSKRDG